MNIKILIIPITLLVLFCSCAKGKKPITKDSKTETAQFNGSLQYADLDEIFTTFETVKKKEYKHMYFNEQLNIICPNKIQSLVLKKNNNYFDNETEITKMFMGDNFDSDQMKIMDDIPYLGLLKQFDDNNRFYQYSNEGFLTWINNSYASKFYFQEAESVGIISCSADFGDMSYRLSDGDMKLSEATDIAQDFLDEYSEITNDLEFIPYSITIAKYGNYYGYIFKICPIHENNVINCVFSSASVISSSFKSDSIFEKVNYAPFGYTLIICTHDGVEAFANNEEKIQVESVQQEYDNIVTLQSALDYVDDNLGNEVSYQIDYIGIENTIYRTEDNKYITHPFWVIDLYSQTEQKMYYAVIDCVTGEYLFMQ